VYCNDVRRRKKLAIINKSTLWFQKGIWLKVKEPNLQQYFLKSSQANKGDVITSTGAAKANCFSVIFQDIIAM
jgi:hypothetical protein